MTANTCGAWRPVVSAALVAACALLATAARSQTPAAPANRLLVLDQDAHYQSTTSAGALFNLDPAASITTSPSVETAVDTGAPFVFVSGVDISPFDGKAYLTDLGNSTNPGALYSIAGGAGSVSILTSAQPLLPDPFDLTFVTTGAAGKRLVVVDWDSDPSSLGPDDVGGAGHGALLWVNEATGALSTLADGTVHGTLGTVASGASAFEDPVAAAFDPSRGVVYVADLSADPLGQSVAGAVFAVDPATGSVSLVSADARFVALNGIAVRTDGSILVVDGVQSDSVLWAIDPTNPNPQGNATLLSGGIQYSLLESVAVDASNKIYLADSGDYDSTTGTFISPPAIWTVDETNPNSGTNSVLVNEAVDLRTPVGLATVESLRIDGVSPSVLPGCAATGATVRVSGAGLSAGLAFNFGPQATIGGTTLVPATQAEGPHSVDVLLTTAASFSGALDLTVTNAFGGTATRTGVVAVTNPQPCSARGDANCDGIVDGMDLAILGEHFGLRRCVDSGFVVNADFNGDGLIDGRDLATLATWFGTRP